MLQVTRMLLQRGADSVSPPSHRLVPADLRRLSAAPQDPAPRWDVSSEAVSQHRAGTWPWTGRAQYTNRVAQSRLPAAAAFSAHFGSTAPTLP